MKQLSSSELNSMTKEEMAAMILQMQKLNAQMQQPSSSCSSRSIPSPRRSPS